MNVNKTFAVSVHFFENTIAIKIQETSQHLLLAFQFKQFLCFLYNIS